MKLRVPANYDLDLVQEFKKNPVTCVYGKFSHDAAGGGRPSYMGTPLSRNELERYVSALHNSGITFNYLMNSSCMGNMEWTRKGQRSLRKLLDKIGSMGIRSLTVSLPYLAEFIKKHEPGFSITIGIYAQVDTVERVKFWEDLGADGVTLESFSINRNFGLLDRIRASTNMELILIANHICIPNCPVQFYHQNMFSHASGLKRGPLIDYCILTCEARRVSNPTEYIRSGWIRPEDTGFYEERGYDSFKLLERDIPSEEILKRVRAYSSRRFDGNLAELLLPYGFKRAKLKPFRLMKYIFRPFQIKPGPMKKAAALIKKAGYLGALKELPVEIDSNQIPADFIKQFEKTDCLSVRCDDCGFCRKVAEKAVHIKDRELAGQLHEIKDMLARGEFWYA